MHEAFVTCQRTRRRIRRTWRRWCCRRRTLSSLGFLGAINKTNLAMVWAQGKVWGQMADQKFNTSESTSSKQRHLLMHWPYAVHQLTPIHSSKHDPFCILTLVVYSSITVSLLNHKPDLYFTLPTEGVIGNPGLPHLIIASLTRGVTIQAYLKTSFHYITLEGSSNPGLPHLIITSLT